MKRITLHLKRKVFTLLFALLLSSQLSAQCWQTVSAGGGQTLAIKTNGKLWGWGENTWGQLGIGKNGSTPIKTQIENENTWSKVSTGLQHTLAIKTDRTLWAWGENLYGQVGDNTYIDKWIPVQIGTDTNWIEVEAGALHSIALKTNGNLVRLVKTPLIW